MIQAPKQTIRIKNRKLPNVIESEIIISVATEGSGSISVCSFYDNNIDEVIEALQAIKSKRS